MTVRDITQSLEAVAPRRLQEDYDTTGLQIGSPDSPCTGVLICVDLTAEIINEAKSLGCNMIVTHHPLMFRGVKNIVGRNRVDDMIVAAIKNDIAVYSCHTAIDNTPVNGVSWEMARMLGLSDITCLSSGGENAGSGAIGNLPVPLSPESFVKLVKTAFNSPVARCSSVDKAPLTISRVALCGGAGSEFIADAIAAGGDVYLTSDCKFNYFLDFDNRIFLVDIGHFESEECTKEIFYQIITEKFPNFAVYKSVTEKNPINYL